MQKVFLLVLDRLVYLWHEFLESLATTGGNIFILLILWLTSLFGVFHVLRIAGVADDARSLLLSTFSGVTGALMYALTQGRKAVVRSGDTTAPPAPPVEVKDDPKPNP